MMRNMGSYNFTLAHEVYHWYAHRAYMLLRIANAGQEHAKQESAVQQCYVYNNGIQNMNLTLGKPFDDGAHILYVNGEYRDDSDIGRLMHDFNCTSADDMHFSILAEKTRYLKENPKGVSEMCKVMEDLRDESYAEGHAEGREEQAKMTAKNLYEQNLSIEQIAKAIGFDIATVEKWLTPKAV